MFVEIMTTFTNKYIYFLILFLNHEFFNQYLLALSFHNLFPIWVCIALGVLIGT